MLSTYLIIILLAFLSGLTTLIGVALAIIFKKNIRGIVIGIGFSAGIMLLISFFELIPESIGTVEINKTLVSLLSGILLVGILSFIIPHTHLIKEKKGYHKKILKTAYLVTFGLILHDLPEGFAMANSYIYSPVLGMLIALSIAIHNIPEEFAMAAPIVLAKDKRFLFKAAFLSGLAEPAGAIIGLFAVHFLPFLNPLFMSFAAGAMIFISIHELMPMAKKYGKISLFILGIVLSVLVYLGLFILFPR